jgi:hypothetical protein
MVVCFNPLNLGNRGQRIKKTAKSLYIPDLFEEIP